MEKAITLEEVRAMVAEIYACKDDDQVAHCYEDALYVRVLEATAAGASNAPELAREALLVQDFDFARWCA